MSEVSAVWVAVRSNQDRVRISRLGLDESVRSTNQSGELMWGRNDPTGGGWVAYGGPWWVAVVGLALAFGAVGVSSGIWHIRIRRVIRQAKKRADSPIGREDR